MVTAADMASEVLLSLPSALSKDFLSDSIVKFLLNELIYMKTVVEV